MQYSCMSQVSWHVLIDWLTTLTLFHYSGSSKYKFNLWPQKQEHVGQSLFRGGKLLVHLIDGSKSFPSKRPKKNKKGGYHNGKSLWKPPTLYSYFQCSRVILATNCVIMECTACFWTIWEEYWSWHFQIYIFTAAKFEADHVQWVYALYQGVPWFLAQVCCRHCCHFHFLIHPASKIQHLCQVSCPNVITIHRHGNVKLCPKIQECKSETKLLISQIIELDIMSSNFIGPSSS